MTTPYVNAQTIHDPTVGGIPPAAWGDAINTNMAYFNTWVGCIVQRSTTQTISDDSVHNFIQWTAPDLHDSDAFHSSTSLTPERILVPSGLGGKYMVGANLVFYHGGISTERELQLWVRVDGGTEYLITSKTHRPQTTTFYYTLDGQFPLILNAGSYIEFGASNKTFAGGSGAPVLYGYGWMRYMGA